jgi:hypothetical protein
MEDFLTAGDIEDTGLIEDFVAIGDILVEGIFFGGYPLITSIQIVG